MSRTRLEQVISEFKLYRDEAKSLASEEIIEFDAKRCQCANQGKERAISQLHIRVRIEGSHECANKLASLFIEENLKLREQTAQGTTEFSRHRV